MTLDPLSSPNPYRPYVVPLDHSPHLISPNKSSPKDLLADLDIPTDYLDNPELSDLISSLVTKGISKYAAIFIRQPFETVKTIMQVQHLSLPGLKPFPPTPSRRNAMDSDDDIDEADFPVTVIDW
jgi:hypothetical protein